MRGSGLLARLHERVFAISGWWMTALLTLVAAALRIPNLGRPNEFSFDETYYAKDAFSYLQFGFERSFVKDANALLLKGSTDVFTSAAEFVVHPPLGKWAIALGIHLFGMNPFGWRIVMAMLGIAAVAVAHRTMLRLSGNPYTAALAGLFFAIDGLAIVMSRTALLDQTLMFFVLCTFYALIRDRDHYRHTLVLHEYMDDVPAVRMLRPWRLLAIVCITAAFASKWSALWFALAFAVMALLWDLRARREFGISASRTWRADIAWVISAAAMAFIGYLGTWIGWFRSTDAWDRTWTIGPTWLPQPLRALLYYHQQALQFHTHLTSSHPYKAAPYWWPLMIRPTSFSYNTYATGTQGCHADSCSAEVIALGNIVIWWVACLVVLALIAHGVGRALQMTVIVREHVWSPGIAPRVQWDVAGPLLIGVAAGWLPWIYWHDRTTFTFYSIVYAPFMYMLAAYGLQLLATHVVNGVEEIHEKRFLLMVLVVSLAVGVTLFFDPIWTGATLSYSEWHARMWLPSWI